jgi:hypothetical protein
LIRDALGEERVVRELKLGTESELHDVLTNNPLLLPAEDLQLDRLAVFGRESKVDSGRPDLVLVDRSAQVCIVEVKREDNPDTRHVIAQLLDYAAALWRMSAEDFERAVLHPYLRSGGQSEPLPGLGTYAAAQFADSGEERAEFEFEDFAQRLGQSLASGQFRLVVAAPDIPVGVQGVIEYLSSQGMLMYGLEISCFGGQATPECYVPRLVAKPRLADSRRSGVKATPITEEDLLDALHDEMRAATQRFLRDCETAGAHVRWQSSGASIRVVRGAERAVAFLERGRAYVTVKAPNGYPVEPFDKARVSLLRVTKGGIGSDGWQYSVRYDDLDDAALAQLFETVLELIRALVRQIRFEEIADPLQLSFTRNDHNIWMKAVPAASDYMGRWLLGSLRPKVSANTAANTTVEVRLEPLGGGASGWKPRFASAEDERQVWPAGQLKGEYSLRITHASPIEVNVNDG